MHHWRVAFKLWCLKAALRHTPLGVRIDRRDGYVGRLPANEYNRPKVADGRPKDRLLPDARDSDAGTAAESPGSECRLVQRVAILNYSSVVLPACVIEQTARLDACSFLVSIPL